MATTPIPAPVLETPVDVVSTPETQPTAADQRTAIVEKYRSLGYDSLPATSAAPVPEAPAPEAPPTSDASAEPTGEHLSPVGGDVSGIREELAALKAALAEALAARSAPAPEPAAPVEATPSEDPDDQWFDLIRQGKVREANALLRASVLEQAKREMLGPAVEQVQAELEQRAAVQHEIDTFNTSIRSNAKDVIDAGFEEQIAARVEFEISNKLANKSITNGPQLVEAYKTAVTKQVEEARKLIQRIRGDGANQARTAAAAAAASSATAVPGDVRPPAATGAKAPPMSPADVIRLRTEAQLASRGYTA